MTAIIDLCNRAIEDVGSAPIDSLTDDTKAARLCNRRYPQLRDALLRLHPWNFAAARASVAALATPPAYGFKRAFQLPTDCLRVLYLQDGWCSGWPIHWSSGTPYLVEGRTIVTDAQAPLLFRYVRQITDPTLFDPLFADTLVAMLAANLCMPLANDKSLLGELQEIVTDRLSLARGVSNLENGDHTRLPTRVLAVRQ